MLKKCWRWHLQGKSEKSELTDTFQLQLRLWRYGFFPLQRWKGNIFSWVGSLPPTVLALVRLYPSQKLCNPDLNCSVFAETLQNKSIINPTINVIIYPFSMWTWLFAWQIVVNRKFTTVLLITLSSKSVIKQKSRTFAVRASQDLLCFSFLML